MTDMTQELHGWRRYAVVFAGMLLAGGVCSIAIPFTIAPSGTIGPTMLQAESAVSAVLVAVVCFAVAAGIAGVVGRFINAAVGLFVLGAGLSVLDLRSGTIRDLAFAEASLGLVAAETALWGLLVLAATIVVFRVAGPLPDIGVDEDDQRAASPWWVRWGLRGTAAGCLVLPAVWLIARSHLKGQTLMAVVLGSMIVGLVGRLLAPTAQPRLLFASACLFGAVGHVIGMLATRDPLSEAFVTRAMSFLSFPMPIDYAAGSLMGVALGLGWAKSFLHREDESHDGSFP
ncbi:MAG: hypothetical protein ACYS0G_01145 [Planctomycetota bacterium]|jgi:hypothetical protein